MGRRSSQKKNAALLDNDDLASVGSSPSTMCYDSMAFSGEEDVLVDRDSLLDQCLDALYEKRGSTREKALALIIGDFNNSIQHEFADKKSATLLHRCLSSIKRGSAKEVALASHVIGLLALTNGPGETAQFILAESVSPISEALRFCLEMSKVSSVCEMMAADFYILYSLYIRDFRPFLFLLVGIQLLACLAVITFVGGEEPEHTEKSMEIMWQVAHPKLGPNVAAAKPSPAMINTVVSAWSFLLTTMEGRALNPKGWQESMSYLSTLLEKNERPVRIAAGEALALIFEIGSLEKFCGESKVSGDISNGEEIDFRRTMYIHGLKNKVINQMRDLSTEAGGRGSSKKDLNNQRNTFRDVLDFIENGYTPETSTKIGGESLNTSDWSELIQLNFLKHFLGGGFVKHMQDNPFLHDVFGFTPKKKILGDGYRMSACEKRMYKSPNSAVNKARTQLLNKQRMISQDKNAGRYAVGFGDD